MACVIRSRSASNSEMISRISKGDVLLFQRTFYLTADSLALGDSREAVPTSLSDLGTAVPS